MFHAVPQSEVWQPAERQPLSETRIVQIFLKNGDGATRPAVISNPSKVKV